MQNDSLYEHRLFNQHANLPVSPHTHNNFPTAGGNKIKMQNDKVNVQK